MTFIASGRPSGRGGCAACARSARVEPDTLKCSSGPEGHWSQWSKKRPAELYPSTRRYSSGGSRCRGIFLDRSAGRSFRLGAIVGRGVGPGCAASGDEFLPIGSIEPVRAVSISRSERPESSPVVRLLSVCVGPRAADRTGRAGTPPARFLRVRSDGGRRPKEKPNRAFISLFKQAAFFYLSPYICAHPGPSWATRHRDQAPVGVSARTSLASEAIPHLVAEKRAHVSKFTRPGTDCTEVGHRKCLFG